MIKRVLIVVAVTVVAVAAFTLWQSHGEAGHPHDEAEEHDDAVEMAHIPLTQQQVNTADLRLGTVTRRKLDAMLRADGVLVLRAQNIGDVTPLMGGVVRSVLVRDGQAVSRGQVVATIENTDVVTLQREYYAACKESEDARQELARQEQLATAGAGVRKNLQQAQRDSRIAHANMVGMARQLSQMGISVARVARGQFTTVFPLRAPIAGTVSQLAASIGSYADMQTPLMKIRNNSAVECDLNVFERDIARVRVGARVVLALTNQPGVTVTGRVYGMNQYFNDGTKAVAVHVRLDAAQGARLFDGMYVSGQIATGSRECDALPTQAIVSADGHHYVFALNGKPRGGRYEFSRHEVTPGVSQNGYTEVSFSHPLRPGQQVVTDNAFYLASLTGEHGEHAH